MRTQPTLTLADMKEVTGISIVAIQKLLDQLIQKKYVERGVKDGSWRMFGRIMGVGSTDHFLKFLYYTSFLTPHDSTSKFST